MSLVGTAQHTADGEERLPGLGTWQQEGAPGTRHLGHSMSCQSTTLQDGVLDAFLSGCPSRDSSHG